MTNIKTKYLVPLEWYIKSSVVVEADSTEDAIEAVEVLLHNEVSQTADYVNVITKVSASTHPGMLDDVLALYTNIEEIGHGGATKRASRKTKTTAKVTEGSGEDKATAAKADTGSTTKPSVPASTRRKAPAKATAKAKADTGKTEVAKATKPPVKRPQRGVA